MVFKSLILSTLNSGLETKVMSPAEYKRFGCLHSWFCQETHAVNGHVNKQSQMQAQNIVPLG